MNALSHWAPRFPCDTCSSKFATESAAEAHMQVQGHYQNYCKSCDRRFQNANNLQMVGIPPQNPRRIMSRTPFLTDPKHLNSRVHRGTQVPCPFCQTGFTSASGLSHHLETGSCNNASSLNRETILALIRQRDPHGVITNKQIGWHPEETTTYKANHLAYNGDAWECYICHSQFSSLHRLNMHLNSPTHKEKVYHCPNHRGGCPKQFVSLARLFNHLESETCSFMRFDKVQQHVGRILDGRRLIAF